MKNKLDSVLTRLDRLFSGEDSEDAVPDEIELERRSKLFE